jgi:glycosyltransferase involved in cell wall biosynthesis
MGIQVTVGICTRNNADTICKAVCSILNQDFPHSDLEIIVVDGNSKDNTLAIAKDRLIGSDIKFKFLKENKGLGYARQLVVSAAGGRYIVWVDGDMAIPKYFISKLFSFIEMHPKIGIVKGTQTLKPGGNVVATLEAYSRVAGKMVNYQSSRAISKVLGTSGCIYRTKAIRMVGGFDPNLRGYCEDWDAEIKVRGAGWALDRIEAYYSGYESGRLSMQNLWKRYWLRGYYTHYFLHKNPGLIKHSRMFPPMAFAAGFLNARKIFRKTHNSIVYLLPFQSFFKFTAWYVGFLNSHQIHYEPSDLLSSQLSRNRAGS